jgi:putative DNA methylase
MKQTKKLIEVALPLVAINKASATEKSIRHGHPSTLHLWWARRPLAAARAVIFAQMVDDPSSHPDLYPTEKKQEKERQRLFRIIEDLVQWENITNEEVLDRARAEIWQSWRAACAENVDHPRAKELFNRHKLPGFHDPFAGGGGLPLEAQRLGLEAHASDLNPVAVLINKAMIEIPPKFAGRPPVNPEWQGKTKEEKAANPWHGAEGLSEDVRYYGQWMRDEAKKRIGHLYPKIEITAAMAKERPDLKPLIGQKLTVIAWLWARTVKSPNPAFAQIDVPLVSTFMLSAKEGKEAYVLPVIEAGGYRFTVKPGTPKDAESAKLGTSAGKRAAFQCIMSGTPIPYDYVRSEGQAGRMGTRMLAIIAEGLRGRVYLTPTEEMENIALKAKPAWRPEVALPSNPRDFKTPNYGLTTFADLYTPRQLVALTTFSDLAQEARARVKHDSIAAGLVPDERSLDSSDCNADGYADAIATYLAFAVDKVSEGSTTICTWSSLPTKLHVVSTFGRQAVPMTWDFAEANVFADSSGNFLRMTELVAEVLTRQCGSPSSPGKATQMNAAQLRIGAPAVISTDPPYYDNIGYADLSDFFFIWLRRALKPVFPDLFATLAVPKAEELVATPYRHGSKEKAESFFLHGMTQAMHRLAEQAHPAFPVTIYYAFKQSESDGSDGTTNTGWDTFLEAVIRAGFAISGTWPVRTERAGGFRNKDQNALASSIVLVCRQRPGDAVSVTRREFAAALKAELPIALGYLQRSNIAPVDLAQTAIGPGMAIYTRYAKVLDAEGKPLPVRDALALINQALDEVLAEQEGDFDADTRWALAWFEQYGFASAEYGVAETLSKAKNTSVSGLVEAGVLASKSGKVHLLKPVDLPGDWDPTTDNRLTVWEMVHHLIRVLEADGESAAAVLAAKMGSKAEVVRELAYRLYMLCERKKRAPEAMAYNALVQSWPEITRLAREGSKPVKGQTTMFEEK